MTLGRVVNKNEIYLDGQFYKLVRQIQSVPASQYASKVLTGDVDATSHPHLSAIRWDNARAGIGKKDHEGAVDVNRIWYGTSWLRVNGHCTLPSRVTTTAASGVSGVFSIGAMAELENKIYVDFGTSIRSYDFNTDSWGSNLQTMSAGATDAITERLGGTVYMVFTNGANYYYTTDGSSWSTVTTYVQFFAGWDDRLWGIDSTGQLRWAFDPTGTWTDDAQLPLPNDYVQDLFVGRDATGNHILYASTKVGLFAHDVDNNQFVRTEMDLPFHNDAGAGVARFRDATYIPAGLGIYKYSLGGGGAVITTVGPDKDQGLPADRRGKIPFLLKTHNDLLAFVDNTAAAAEDLDLFASGGLPAHTEAAVNPETGRSLILAWDEVGWQVLFESGAIEQSIDAALVSNAYGGYRLFFAQDERVHYLELPVDIVNPDELSDREYADASRDDGPWFTAGQTEINKTAVRMHWDVSGASSSETVTPYVGYDFDDDTWTALSAISSNGVTTYTFPNTTAATTTDATGTAFNAFRWRRDLVNGTNNRLSPDVRSITLEYRKKLPFKEGWRVEIDLSDPDGYSGQPPKEARASLLAATKSKLRVEFTFRDDEGNTRNHYVDVTQPTGLEETGHDERGVTSMVLLDL
tara:strand:- start:5932 stop:7833 length:1902 start_codon:yes stop_codon:yes gene_type:complete